MVLCVPFLGPSHESPVLLKKFHFAPRLRPLMSLGSIKKESQINMPECHQGFTLMQTQGLRFSPQPRYLSKSPPRPKKREAPLRSPYGAPAWRKILHHQTPFYMSLKVPRKETPLQAPLTERLHRRKFSISRALFTYIKIPKKEAPSPGSLLRAPQKQTFRSQNPPLPVSRSPR
jgi:hypothetical protein